MSLADLNFDASTDVDVALIADVDDPEQGFLIEHLAGNRFNVHIINAELGDIWGDPVPFESLSEALRWIADELE